MSIFKKIIIFQLFLMSYSSASDNLLTPIKDILRRDYLDQVKKEQEEKYRQEKLKKVDQKEEKKDVFMSENDFWGLITNYWLIKNSDVLKWDFKKVDYGILDLFKKVLSSLGVKNQKVRILYLNSNLITHIALPEGANGITFLLSKPFVERMDLTKQEICMLLVEDYLRVNEGIVKRRILSKIPSLGDKKIKKGKEIRKYFSEVIGILDEVILNKGFSFQEQFNVTKNMVRLLGVESSLKKNYVNLIYKINELIKSNSSYKAYSRYYPSPDMQLKWLEAEGVKREGI